MRFPEDFDEPVSVTSRILANAGPFGPDDISSRTEQEIKAVDGHTPFFLIRVTVASLQDAASENNSVLGKGVPNRPLAIVPPVPNLNTFSADGPINKKHRGAGRFAGGVVPIIEYFSRSMASRLSIGFPINSGHCQGCSYQETGQDNYEISVAQHIFSGGLSFF
jgi:hypothetical protein